MLDRPISGADLAAHLRHFGPSEADHAAFAGRVHPDAAIVDLVDLQRRCPPEAIGVRPGAYAALFAPLFGEFE